MAHDVFVSYPSVDKTTADAVVSALESHGLRCWYAPRDVEPGADWAGAIVHAIKESRLTVLVFSGAANSSEHILREVRQAADAHTPILPFRISAADPSEPLQYYIGGTHWLDALTEPIEEHLGELVDTTDRLLKGSPSGRAEPKEKDKAPTIQPAAPTSGGRRNLILAAIGGAIVLVAAIVAFSFLNGGTDNSPAEGDDAQTATDGDDALVDARPDFSGTVEDDTDEDDTDDADAVEIVADDGWQTLSFITTDPQVWDVSVEDRLTALQQENIDAFAWSTENVDGDFAVRLDMETPGTESSGCMVLYGAAQPFHTQGSLIFCLTRDFYTLEKHTTYHSGDNFVSFAPANIVFPNNIYDVEIQITGNVASMFVDNTLVLSTVLDRDEIDDRGRIGLFKHGPVTDVTFSNVRLSVSTEERTVQLVDDELDCVIDTGANPDFHPLSSPHIDHGVQIDGAISSPDEWQEAECVDLRMHYGINALNPNFAQARWWSQHDEESIYFLTRIPAELGFDTAYVDYFWPEFTGSWEHNDAIAISSDGTVSDSGQWDELQFYDDTEMDPPGTFDVSAAFTEDPDFVWAELQHPLDSGDGYDWNFELGGKYGNNPFDTVLVGVEVNEGTFLRNVQLTIEEP